jgi:predicted phage terminase large subunit-like protein
VRGPWNEAFLAELENFPEGLHDDQVDAASDAFDELANAPRVGVWGTKK